MPPRIDLTGQRFGRLVVAAFSPRKNKSNGNALWECVCDCGNRTITSGVSLRRGTAQSCGCFGRDKALASSRARHEAGLDKKHGFTGTPTYGSWQAMLRRCTKPNRADYADYGARGISVCERWQGKDGFTNFLADMGPRPEGKTLDRFPNHEGNYEPGNCRWASPSEQTANQRAWDAARIARNKMRTSKQPKNAGGKFTKVAA